jgi:hypothetical protein
VFSYLREGDERLQLMLGGGVRRRRSSPPSRASASRDGRVA